jgi:MFS family permease
MKNIINAKLKSMNKKILFINFFSFFVALHYALISYYGSTFLAKIIGNEYVWLIYSFGAILTLLTHLFTNKLIRKININTLVPNISIIAVLNLIVLFALQSTNLSTNVTFWLIPIHFALYIAFAQGLFMIVSVMLEDLSKDSKTGSLRGTLLSITNVGYLLAPFLAKIILQNGGQDKNLFLASAIICAFTYFIFILFIREIPKITIHEKTNLKNDLKQVWNNKDVRNILILQTIVEMFYAGFVIYIPLKLISLGLSTSTYLGLILPISLTPFLFIPTWLGYLEDKIKDEKQILQYSFLLLSLVLSLFSFINSTSFFIWAIVIFFSRVATSAIETSTASYLFKKINVKNTSVITFYNSTQPIAYFLSPIIFGSIYFASESFNLVFIANAIFTLLAIGIATQISETENKEKNAISVKNKIKNRFTKILKK